jgi:hypothetical protein
MTVAEHHARLRLPPLPWTPLMRSIENTLALWVTGLRSSETVVDWAHAAIAKANEPSQELFDLASYGPERCLKWAQHDFPPRAAAMTYIQQFSIRAAEVRLDSAESALAFADWASRCCMGDDLAEPMVAFGYHLDHLLVDCEDSEAALAFVRDQLPALMPRCKVIAAPFLEDEA